MGKTDYEKWVLFGIAVGLAYMMMRSTKKYKEDIEEGEKRYKKEIEDMYEAQSDFYDLWERRERTLRDYDQKHPTFNDAGKLEARSKLYRTTKAEWYNTRWSSSHAPIDVDR